MKSEIPQGPWYNPALDEGIYDARIVCLTKGSYGSNKDPYIQVVMFLPEANCHFTNNLYFPKGQPDAKTVQRLSRLCQILGLQPQDALDSPQFFSGCELKVKIAVFKNGDREYRDVALFMHPDS